MQGFSVPRSPQGRTSLTPPPPWFYAGNLLLIDYAADPQAVAAVVPPGLAPDPGDPGGCTAFFVDWQYASTSGEELTDPVRSQYHDSWCSLRPRARVRVTSRHVGRRLARGPSPRCCERHTGAR
jgi:hypothetical protein